MNSHNSHSKLGIRHRLLALAFISASLLTMSCRMGLANRSLCYVLLNKIGGKQRMSADEVHRQGLVRKADGSIPSAQAIRYAAKHFLTEKAKRGRKEGYCKTSKDEDRALM